MDLKDRDNIVDVYKWMVVLTNMRHHLVEKFEQASLSAGKNAIYDAKTQLEKIKVCEKEFKKVISEYIQKHAMIGLHDPSFLVKVLRIIEYD